MYAYWRLAKYLRRKCLYILVLALKMVLYYGRLFQIHVMWIKKAIETRSQQGEVGNLLQYTESSHDALPLEASKGIVGWAAIQASSHIPSSTYDEDQVRACIMRVIISWPYNTALQMWDVQEGGNNNEKHNKHQLLIVKK